MTDTQTALAQVREALSAGPTPGPWHHDSDPIKNDPLHRVRFRVTAKGRTITETYYSSAQPGAPFTSGEADNRFIAACSPANIAAVLAHVDAQAAEIKRLRQWEIAGREWLDKTDWMQSNDAPARWLGRHRADCLREEIERLRAERDSIAIENSKFMDQIERLTAERDEHAHWRRDLADKLHDRETTISAAWEALRSAGVHSEAAIDDGIRLLRRQIAEAQKEIHNLNWALGTEGYDQMATPEEQAEHEAAVRAHHNVLERLEEGKRAYEAMKRDARRYRWLRNEASTARKCDPMVCIYPLDEQDLIDGDRLDVAIDAAMDLTRTAEES